MQAKENPNTTLVASIKQIKVSLCANGTFPPELFTQAQQQLFKHGEIAHGERYICYPKSRTMAIDAIEWVSKQDDVDKRFIGRMNKLIQSGELDA
jgi:hypothetical protein